MQDAQSVQVPKLATQPLGDATAIRIQSLRKTRKPFCKITSCRRGHPSPKPPKDPKMWPSQMLGLRQPGSGPNACLGASLALPGKSPRTGACQCHLGWVRRGPWDTNPNSDLEKSWVGPWSLAPPLLSIRLYHLAMAPVLVALNWMAVGQNQWDPILGDWCTTHFRTYVCGDWDVRTRHVTMRMHKQGTHHRLWLSLIIFPHPTIPETQLHQLAI